MLAKAFEQFEAGYTRRRLDVLQVDVFAGVAFYEILCAHQVIRQLDAQLITKFGAVVIGLGKDEPLDQRAFDIAGEKHLTEQVVTALQLIDVVTGQPPPGGRGAVDRIHHRLETQRRLDRPLQQAFQRLAHRRPRNHHLQLAAIAGNRQHLVLVGRDDHALIAVGTQALAVLAQLLLAYQRQAQAVAAEVFGVLDVDGHVGAVFDHAQGGGAGLEHVGAVMETQALGRGRRQAVRPADAGHPAAGALQVEAFDTDIACMATHQAAPTAVRRLRALAARRDRSTASSAPRRQSRCWVDNNARLCG